MANDIFKELGWDDEVSQESTFTLLEEGDYQFSLINMERGRHTGSKNLPACNKAILDIAILDRDGNKLTMIFTGKESADGAAGLGQALLNLFKKSHDMILSDKVLITYYVIVQSPVGADAYIGPTYRFLPASEGGCGHPPLRRRGLLNRCLITSYFLLLISASVPALSPARPGPDAAPC